MKSDRKMGRPKPKNIARHSEEVIWRSIQSTLEGEMSRMPYSVSRMSVYQNVWGPVSRVIRTLIRSVNTPKEDV